MMTVISKDMIAFSWCMWALQATCVNGSLSPRGVPSELVAVNAWIPACIYDSVDDYL